MRAPCGQTRAQMGKKSSLFLWFSRFLICSQSFILLLALEGINFLLVGASVTIIGALNEKIIKVKVGSYVWMSSYIIA